MSDVMIYAALRQSGIDYSEVLPWQNYPQINFQFSLVLYTAILCF
jgi:hypothetical protein